jgi:hypothetical protein
MSITIALPPEKEQRLREIYGSDENIADAFSLLVENLTNKTPLVDRPLRVPGLFKDIKGKFYMAEDFDDPLPDSFWFGDE